MVVDQQAHRSGEYQRATREAAMDFEPTTQKLDIVRVPQTTKRDPDSMQGVQASQVLPKVKEEPGGKHA